MKTTFAIYYQTNYYDIYNTQYTNNERLLYIKDNTLIKNCWYCVIPFHEVEDRLKELLYV